MAPMAYHKRVVLVVVIVVVRAVVEIHVEVDCYLSLPTPYPAL